MPTTKTEQFSRTDLENIAKERIGEWLRRADVLPNFPLQNREVVEVLRAIDYELSVATIGEFLDAGYLAPPANRSGRFYWTATDIMHFAMALEARERWQKFSPIHDCKKSAARRGRELAEQNGQAESVFSDIERYTLEDLILYLCRADDRRVRDQIREAVLIKLEQING